MKQFAEDSRILKWLVSFGDFGVLVITTALVYALFGRMASNYLPSITFNEYLLINTLCFFPSITSFTTVVHQRIVAWEKIVHRAAGMVLVHLFCTMVAMDVMYYSSFSYQFFVIFYVALFALIVSWRVLARFTILNYRSQGGNTRRAVIVGSYSNVQELYNQMVDNPTLGYKIAGVFDDRQPENFLSDHYMGGVDRVIPFIQANGVDEVFCCLPSSRGAEIAEIIDYCENSMVRFYSVPNVRNYLKREMKMELFGDLPVLCIREEPLTLPENRMMKRMFDMTISTVFLCTLYPIIYIIVGIVIKITSPGPIYFKQERTGADGRVFRCIKFRSMKVNNDSDKVQATKDDPRKTKFGNFLRKSNIDELPQFINVWKGEMSIVGPRPHMLRHTDEYSRQINKFMVRHLVKPGITGWAQVTGFRGETRELCQMEGRVKKDIWYIEHWSVLLDVQIIIKTVTNAIGGDKQAY